MKYNRHEVLFQIAVHLIVFIFYGFERNTLTIPGYKYFNFLNYAITAGVINYALLPKFYRNKKALHFAIGVIASILLAALAEEYIFEKLLFTGKRADTIMMIYAFVDIIPVVGILVGLKFGWDAYVKQEEVERLQETVKDSELQFLKSQINPHFLFNNLNNLYSYALEASPKTPEIILELSGLLRYMLYECRKEYVSLSKELEHLQNFVNLHALQIEDRGSISLNISDNSESFNVAPLIMIVFVENAFKHSQNSQSDKIEIDITIKIIEDSILHFRCSNTYHDEASTVYADSGIGLSNVKKRLALIYPDEHTLSIDNSDNQYIVDLTIDLQQK